MALTDPQSITVSGTARSMPLVKREGAKASYANDDELWSLTISHEPRKGNRTGSTFKFTQRKTVTNPLDSSKADYDELKLSFTIDRPGYGFTKAETQAMATGFFARLDSTLVGQLYGKES